MSYTFETKHKVYWGKRRENEKEEKLRREKDRELEQHGHYLKTKMECEGCHRWKTVQINKNWYCPTCQTRK
jgi:hypothetical protein